MNKELNNWLHKDSGQKAALTCEPERYANNSIMENSMNHHTWLFVNNYLPEEHDLMNFDSNQYNDREGKCLKYHYTNVDSLKKY